MTSIAPDMITALTAEAIATPTGLANWALKVIDEAPSLATGRALEGIIVEASAIVYYGERSTDYADKAWPIAASALALRSEVLNSPCATDAMEAKLVRLRRAAEFNNNPATDGMIRDLMEQAKAKFPKLGLSYGYIGNCDFGGRYDNRSFYIFTNLREARGGYSVMFGGVDAMHLGSLLVKVETGLDAWCELQMKRRYDFNEVYTVGSDLKAA